MTQSGSPFRRAHEALCLRTALIATAFAAPALPAAAHEVPARVTVVAFVKPEADRLRLLVRVPLVAIRDVEFPLHGPGYLSLDRIGPLLDEAAKLWIADYVELFADGRPLGDERIVATRVSLPSDPSFRSWEYALAHTTGPPLPPATELVGDQALLDVLLEVPIGAERARFAISPGWAHLGLTTNTVLRFLPAGGGERVFQYTGHVGIVRLDPRWHQATVRFIRSGFAHILTGWDHLLFLLCLVIPFRRFGALVPVVTAFTVAHSVTLIAAATGLAPSALWFPPLIETLIALSIVYMAFENIVGARLQRRWAVAFGFGLVHGFGFAFLLRETLQFAGSHVTASLLAFNVGVELGQLVVLALAIPVLDWLFRRVVAERIGTILLSALVAHTAWHWTTARGAQLMAYPLAWPVIDARFAAAAMRWAMLALLVGALAWALAGLFERWSRWSSNRWVAEPVLPPATRQ